MYFVDSKGTTAVDDDDFAGLQMALDITEGSSDITAVLDPATLLLPGSGLTLAAPRRRANR